MNKKEQAIKLDKLIDKKIKLLFSELMKELKEYNNIKNRKNAWLVKIQKEYEKKIFDLFKKPIKKSI